MSEWVLEGALVVYRTTNGSVALGISPYSQLRDGLTVSVQPAHDASADWVEVPMGNVLNVVNP